MSHLPVGQGLHFYTLLSIYEFIALNKGKVRFGRHVGRTSESLEIIHTLLSHSILERAHAVDHLLLGFQTTVNIVGREEVFRHYKE